MGAIFDDREAAVGLSRLPRAVCESVGERRRDGAGSLPILAIRSHRCFHSSWRKSWARPIFDDREAAVGLSRLPRAVCESVGERRRDGVTARAACRSWLSGHTGACTHGCRTRHNCTTPLRRRDKANRAGFTVQRSDIDIPPQLCLQRLHARSPSPWRALCRAHLGPVVDAIDF